MVKAQKTSSYCREYTIHVHKMVRGIAFRKRAPKAMASIKKFAVRAMGAEDVRIDTAVNKFIWTKGIKNPPHRIRVRLTRHINQEEGAKSRYYTTVEWVPVSSFKGLTTTVVADEQ